MLERNVPSLTFLIVTRGQKKRCKMSWHLLSLTILFKLIVCYLLKNTRVFLWLFCEQVKKVPEKLLSFAVHCKNLTVSNTRTVLLTPEIYVSQNIYEQLVDLFRDGFSGARRFISKSVLSWRCLSFLLTFSFFTFLYVPRVSEPEELVEFVEEVIAGIISDQEVRTFEEVMVPVFEIFHGRVKDLDLCQPLLYSYLDVLLYFSHNKDIAKVRGHRGSIFVN